MFHMIFGIAKTKSTINNVKQKLFFLLNSLWHFSRLHSLGENSKLSGRGAAGEEGERSIWLLSQNALYRLTLANSVTKKYIFLVFMYILYIHIEIYILYLDIVTFIHVYIHIMGYK